MTRWSFNLTVKSAGCSVTKIMTYVIAEILSMCCNKIQDNKQQKQEIVAFNLKVHLKMNCLREEWTNK